MKYQFKPGSITVENIPRTFKAIRNFSYIGMGLIIISSTILVLASLNKLPFASVLGPVDAIIAFAIIGITIYLHYLSAKVRELGLWNIPYKKFTRSFQLSGVIAGIIILLIWNFRNQIDLNILLPGVAWRIFIILNAIPFTLIGFTHAEAK